MTTVERLTDDMAHSLRAGLAALLQDLAGVIPRYARSASGELDDTVIFYRWL